MSFKKDMKNKYYVQSESNIDDIKQNLIFKEKQRKGISPRLVYGLMALAPVFIFVLIFAVIAFNPANSAMNAGENDIEPGDNHNPSGSVIEPENSKNGSTNYDAGVLSVDKMKYEDGTFYILKDDAWINLSVYDAEAYNNIMKKNYALDENGVHIRYSDLEEEQELYLVNRDTIYTYDIRK